MKNKAGMFGKFFRWFNPAGTQPAECNNAARDTIDCVPAPVHVGQAAHSITATKRTTRRTPLCAALLSVFLLFANGLFTNGYSVTPSQKTPSALALRAKITTGKVSFVIEKKTLTPAQAATAIANKTQIPLTVWLKFTGDWVNKFKTYNVNTNNFQMSYGIAKSDGTTYTDAPFFTNDPPAYMVAGEGLGCSQNGVDLMTPYEDPDANVIYRQPSWEGSVPCPVYNYGVGFSSGSTLDNQMEERTEDGETVVYVRLCHIYFVLKRAETVYVRGVDKNYGTDVGETGTSAMETNLNLKYDDNNSYWAATYANGNEYSGINASTGHAGSIYDWTTAPAAFYGGIIPGGIFIATGPEVTPLVTSWV